MADGAAAVDARDARVDADHRKICVFLIDKLTFEIWIWSAQTRRTNARSEQLVR